MEAAAPLKKSLYMKEWMAQADPPKEANTVKKKWMVSRHSSFQIKRHFTLKNGRQQVVLWKKYIVFTKI